MPKPLREFLRIRLNDCNRRGSILVSKSFAFSRSLSSSCLVSAIISSNSPFFCSRSFFRSSKACSFLTISFSFSALLSVNSFIFFSQSSISSVWYSISLVKKSYSRLLRTFSCCVLYFSTEAFAVSISTFLPAMQLCLQVWTLIYVLKAVICPFSMAKILAFLPRLSAPSSGVAKCHSIYISQYIHILNGIV